MLSYLAKTPYTMQHTYFFCDASDRSFFILKNFNSILAIYYTIFINILKLNVAHPLYNLALSPGEHSG